MLPPQPPQPLNPFRRSRPRTGATVHPASPIRHARLLTERAPPRPRSAARRIVHRQALAVTTHGVLRSFSLHPPPPWSR